MTRTGKDKDRPAFDSVGSPHQTISRRRMAVSELPLIARARGHGDSGGGAPRREGHGAAILTPEGVFSYRQLLDASARVAAGLLDGAADLHEQRVAFLTPPGFGYAAVQWGIWRAG